MKKATVKFSVGVEHPLYDKFVEAIILNEECGYDKRQVYAKTIDEVYYPEVSNGILVFEGGKLTGYENAPSRSEVHEGYVSEVKEDVEMSDFQDVKLITLMKNNHSIFNNKVRKISDDTYELVEYLFDKKVDYARIRHAIINHNDYSLEQIEEELSWYDYNLETLKSSQFSGYYDQVLCECLFDRYYEEQEYIGNSKEAIKFLRDNFNIEID